MTDEYLAMEEFQPGDKLDYGILRKSGRYPYGSGKDQTAAGYVALYQVANDLKSKGIPEKEVAQSMGLSVADLRSATTIAKEQIVAGETARIVGLAGKQMSIKAIAEEMDMPQPTVRLRLKNAENTKQSSLVTTATMLRSEVDKHKIVDIGKGTELHVDTGTAIGISPEKLKAATNLLVDEGYETYNLQVRQVGKNNFTNQKVIVSPGTTYGDAKKMTDDIHTIGKWTEDDGKSYFGLHEPVSINPSRLKVNFAEEGGTNADGVVYVRPGVNDLDMGKNTYAQVRIKIGDGHFIKGMAVLNNDMPDGVDLVFNTNKKKDVGKLGSLKPLKDDPDNPFGSVIKRQIVETDPKTGKERAKSAINLVNEEGDWDSWRDSLPSQMLAKQPHSLIKSQLQETRDQVNKRLDEIDGITNPVVRKKAFEDFADQIDSDAVDLRAAAMPRQRTQVIIPLPKINKNEIYAPNFETGEKVVLIRYPHGGRFEIPEVTVNNNSRIAKKLLGNATDAIGIHPSVAERLSGADFDGDTVVVIPNRAGKIKGSTSLGSAAKVFEDGLGNFDAKTRYGGYEVITPAVGKQGQPGYKPEVGNFKKMTNTGLEMGMITNLITDMSIQGAKPEHVVRAVKHSMVVIDAEKHKLNYKQSAIDNNISQLKELYQGSSKSGAKTLLSRATAEERIPDRKLRPAAQGGAIDKETGKLQYVDTGKMKNKYDAKTQTYLDEKVPVTKGVKRLALTDDAHTLVRDGSDPVERLYADHANGMKAMANAARLRADRTVMPKINTKAREVYRAEVDNLNTHLREAIKQKPLDRRADVIAGTIVKAKRTEDPLLRTDRDRLKKVERQAAAAARARLNLSKPVIPISDREWDAIQSGAVSASKLREILGYADPKRVSQLSMPRGNAVMTQAISSRAKSMLSAGATTADVAAALGVSVATLKSAQSRGDV